jgi:hypothetical protein
MFSVLGNQKMREAATRRRKLIAGILLAESPYVCGEKSPSIAEL